MDKRTQEIIKLSRDLEDLEQAIVKKTSYNNKELQFLNDITKECSENYFTIVQNLEFCLSNNIDEQNNMQQEQPIRRQ